MSSCRDFTVLMSRELDRPLTWWQRFLLRTHLLTCGKCGRFRRQLRFLSAAIEDYLTAEVEPNVLRQLDLLPAEARRRLEATLRRETS